MSRSMDWPYPTERVAGAQAYSRTVGGLRFSRTRRHRTSSTAMFHAPSRAPVFMNRHFSMEDLQGLQRILRGEKSSP